MPSVTDLPLRESASPRGYALAEHVNIKMPPTWEWLKAGFWLTIGAWCAGVVLLIPTFIVWVKFATWVLQLLNLALARRL